MGVLESMKQTGEKLSPSNLCAAGLFQPCALAPVHAHSSHAHLVDVHRFGGKKRKESEAATKVQAQVRGQQARKSVSGMKKCGGWCKCFSSAKA